MSGIEMSGDEPQMMGGRQSQTSVKTILKFLQMWHLDWSSYEALVSDFLILNDAFLKCCFQQYRKFMECRRGDNRCPRKIIITWIRWLRNPCSEYHLYGKCSGHCITTTYICVIYGLTRVTHIDTFLRFTQSSEVDISVPILKVSKWR